MANYNGEAATFEAAAGTLQTSPYTPDEDARLVGLRVIPGGEAATSLILGIQFRLTCTTFKPNTIHAWGQGAGLQTVPMVPPEPQDYEVDQPVKAGVPITIEARHNVATAVTNNTQLMGLFQS